MPKSAQMALPGFEAEFDEWQTAYAAQLPDGKSVRNRSGIEVQPLYTPRDWDSSNYREGLGMPGQAPFTRGIYATMHRGRTWSQRQLIGLGIPQDYNKRLRGILDAGATALSMIPCTTIFRGVDADTVDPLLLGNCGTLVNTVEDMDIALEQGLTWLVDLCNRYDAGTLDRESAAKVKVECSRRASDLLTLAMEVCGGVACFDEFGLSRHHRDLFVCRVGEGSNFALKGFAHLVEREIGRAHV